MMRLLGRALAAPSEDVVMKNRWVALLAGVLVMASLGSIYSWSVFSLPLHASFGWSTTTVTWTFSIATFFLSLGAVVGGRWQDRIEPRLVILAGASLWGVGSVLAGLGTSHFGPIWLYCTYGVVGGFGVGMAYVTPVAVVTKWFPDRRGLGTGMVVMGFGLGACIYTLIVRSLPAFDAAAVAAAEYAASARLDVATATLAPHHVQAVMNVFVGSGAAFLVLGVACAFLLRNPPDTALRAAVQAREGEERQFTTPEMLRTPQFYLLWLMLFVNVAAGILVIGNALPIMQELTGLPPKTVAAAFGGAAVANVAGRLFWGAVSDRFGRGPTFAALFGIQALAFFMLAGMTSLPAVTLAFSLILFCYGGGFGTMPSFSADYFGTRHMGANYGILLTAWGMAGIVGPVFAAQMKDATGSYSGSIPVVAVILLGAVILPLLTKRPKQADVVEAGSWKAGQVATR
jgi:MFS transporter, OFA family, oxalate/formate antiporter